MNKKKEKAISNLSKEDIEKRRCKFLEGDICKHKNQIPKDKQTDTEDCEGCHLWEDAKKIELFLPREGKLISKFAREVGDILKGTNDLFFRLDTFDIVEINTIELQNEKGDIYTGFVKVRPKRFITFVEKHSIPCIEKEDKKAEETFSKEKSMSSELADTLLHSEELQKKLPQIRRILSFPMPIFYKDKLTFPKKGFDKRFGSWLSFDSPNISNSKMKLEEAKKIIEEVLCEFCFENEQDKINAIAGLLTPLLKGLFSKLSIRTPVFFYQANRERAGKDYLAGITGIIYEGENLEDSSISSEERFGSNSTEELRKKILSALMCGRTRMHFSNNKGYINNSTFEGITTAEKWADRILGRNELLSFDNEICFSLSGNTGIRYTPDFANRCRFINLFLDIEDANKRNFENPELHKWVKENRELILSALYTLIREWIKAGKPKGEEPFASFYEWANVCGGIMENAGYGSPCITNNKNLNIGGDAETTDMKTLFEEGVRLYEGRWVSKEDIRNVVLEEKELLPDIDFNNKGDTIKFGILLNRFIGRILSNIRLEVKNKSIRASRYEYRFVKIK